jgi:hypothetical protein
MNLGRGATGQQGGGDGEISLLIPLFPGNGCTIFSQRNELDVSQALTREQPCESQLSDEFRRGLLRWQQSNWRRGQPSGHLD